MSGGAGLDALEGCARGIVAAALARPDAFLAEELDRGQEQILEETELVTVEVVERRDRARRVVAVVAHELADMGPVLLLNVSVVVFLVGPPPRKLDRLRLAVAGGGGLAFRGRQPPINLPGADRAQLAAHGGGQAQPAPGPGQPRRQQRLQAYGPRVPRRLPDHPQRLDHRARIRRGPAPPARPRCARGRTVEEPQRVPAMVARRPTELIEDPPLARP